MEKMGHQYQFLNIKLFIIFVTHECGKLNLSRLKRLLKGFRSDEQFSCY